MVQMAYSPTLALIAGVGENGDVRTSADAISWAVRFVPDASVGNLPLSDIVWAPNVSPRSAMFVGCSTTGGRIIKSIDGVIWTSEGLALASGLSQSSLARICYNASLDLFCVVGQLGFVATSRDATTWTRRTTPFIANVLSVASLETKGFVALVGSAIMLHSPDGVTWTSTGLPTAFSTQHNSPLYYSSEFGGVFIPASVGPIYMFTNDGHTITIGQGIAPGSSEYNFLRHDPDTDLLIAGTDEGVAVMERSYDRRTEFVLPTLANTWIRST
jgi:hypothetical protein